MKILGAILILVLTVISSVFLTLYVIELFNDVLVDKIWAKCNNPACKAEYQTSKKGYFKYVEEHADPMSPTAPPMVCEKCGEQSVFRAEKCMNPDCGIVFLWGSVRNDFADRCPECKRSETEENRKRSRKPK